MFVKVGDLIRSGTFLNSRSKSPYSGQVYNINNNEIFIFQVRPLAATFLRDKNLDVLQEKARVLLKQAIAKFPNHGQLYRVLGEQYERDGSFQEAREIFTKGLENDPTCATVYHAAALLEARLGNLEVRLFIHSIILYIYHGQTKIWLPKQKKTKRNKK